MSSGVNWYTARLLGISDSQDENIVQVLKPVKETSEDESEDLSGRFPFQRDLDRIKYTREFRRLKDVTQVARAGESYLYHDRLNHSLKVAQVGRRFAEYILRQEPDSEAISREIDPNLIEAACLAHDLGHPPFGHLAESTLDDLLQEKTNPYRSENDLEPPEDIELPDNVSAVDADVCDAYLREVHDQLPGIRFEGNAQSFRILTRLANHREAHTGLALTLGVLLGVGKYPYGRGEWFDTGSNSITDPDDWPEDPASLPGRSDDKFGFYKDDHILHEELQEAAQAGAISESGRTAAASLMDYADDLTYAIHDLTDFYMDGRLPLDRLLREALGELDEQDMEGLDDVEYESAPRRELEKLHDALEYDESVATPTSVVTSLVTTVVITGKSAALLEPFEGTPEQRDEIEAFTSFLVEEYLNRVYRQDISQSKLEEDTPDERYATLRKTSDGCELRISERLDEQLSILQQITKYYVIRQPSLMAQQRGQQQVIRELFDALYDEAGKDELSWSAIPKPYRDWLEDDSVYLEGLDTPEERKARAVADFIASMTEPQVVALHKRLTGDNPGSLQNEIVR